MKNWLNIKRVIAIISAVSVTICASLFVVMYANSRVKIKVAEDNNSGEKKEISAEHSAVNVITPSCECSYGELMFAYIGKNNFLYNLDNDNVPLVNEPASSLLYASDDTVLYTAAAETDSKHPDREYVIRELQIGEKENALNTISTVSVLPCWSSNDEVIYYVEESDRKQLCTFEPLTSSIEKAARFKEEVMGLRISSDGLLVTLKSGEEELYVPLSKGLTKTHFDSRNCIIKVCEQYDLIISSSGELFYRWIGSDDAFKISENVLTSQGYQDNEIFYVKKSKKGYALFDYYVSENKNVKLCELTNKLLPQLTVSAENAFLIDEAYNVYRYDIESKKLEPYCALDKNVLNPMISVFDYRLMVYDLSRRINNSFVCEYDAEKTEKGFIPRKLKRNGDKPTLMMTSVGKDVRMLQEKLLMYGYLHTEPNGVFDINTMNAVKNIQCDMGEQLTGVADSDFLNELENEKQISYKKYELLSVTAKGTRVNDINERLLTLGYTVSSSGYIFSDESVKGLNAFINENRLKSDNIFDKEIQKTLFSQNAVANSGFVSLKIGDICPKAFELNSKLKNLGYIKGSINPSVDKKTIDGLLLFEEVNNLPESKIASIQLQKTLFSEKAKRCPRKLEPADILDTDSKNKGQVISDRQLKIIRKWLTKQFAINHTDKQAVKRLQKQLEKSGYLKRNQVTMIYDKSTFEAVKSFQKENRITPDGIASKDTLTSIFSSTIAVA